MNQQLSARYYMVALTLLFTIGLIACNKKNIFETAGEGSENLNMQVVRLEKQNILLEPGQTVGLKPYFFPAVENPGDGFGWKNEDPDIIEMKMNDDFSITVTGKQEGMATIIIQNKEGVKVASCEVTVAKEQMPAVTLNIQQATLLVGNDLTINPVVSPPAGNPAAFFQWKVNDTSLVSLQINSDFSVKVTAKKVGNAIVSVVNKQSGETVVSAAIKLEDDVIVGTLVHPVQISLGSATDVPAEWNPLSSPSAGASIPNLIDKEGNPTGVSISIVERFNGTNNDGAKVTNTLLDMPASVSGSSFYGNSFGAFGGAIVEKSVLQIAGLNKDLKYDFCFFGSRAAGDNRDTKFIVEGENNGSGSINTASNSDKVACVEHIYPDADGIIKVTITAGDNNNNATGFYYMGAMRIAGSN